MALIDGVVGSWGWNSTANDLVNDNHGTLFGATYDTSDKKVGDASVVLDGIDDKIVIANETNFDFERTQAFSLATWFKTSASGFGILFSKLRFAWPYWGYEFTLGDAAAITDNLVMFLVRDGANDRYIKVRGNTVVNDGQWRLGVMTYNGNGAASGVKIYVDGALETLTVMLDTLDGSMLTDVPLHIGGRENNSSVWSGRQDASVVWNREITAAEVTELWNGGAGIEIGVAAGVGQLLAPKIVQVSRIQKAIHTDNKMKVVR